MNVPMGLSKRKLLRQLYTGIVRITSLEEHSSAQTVCDSIITQLYRAKLHPQSSLAIKNPNFFLGSRLREMLFTRKLFMGNFWMKNKRCNSTLGEHPQVFFEENTQVNLALLRNLLLQCLPLNFQRRLAWPHSLAALGR